VPPVTGAAEIVVDTRKDPERRRGGAPAPSGGPTQRTVFSLSEEETLEFGRSLARQLEGGELIVLEGDLGLGKTVFVRGIAAGLDLPTEDVWSPTYTLVHEYRGGRLPLYHVDLYRVEGPEEIATLGLEDLLSSGAVVVAEWGERLPPFHRRDATTVRFHDIGEGSRRIEICPAPAKTAKPPGSDA
jgi:tRNA threonylcarbamoyladenosine biosynthesis protein TsaE